MSVFGGLILTNQGRNLQTKAQLGTVLNYTRIAIGDGTLGGTSILNLSALINERKSLPITKLQLLTGGRALIRTVLSNSGLATGFYFRELGVFAQDPDLGEILYCYGNAGALAEFIPAAGGPDVLEKTIDIETIVGNAANVSAVIDSSLIFETPDGAQAKATLAEQNAKSYTDAHENKDAPHSGHETPLGAEIKAAHAEANAKVYTDQEVAVVNQRVASHEAETPSEINVHGLRTNALSLCISSTASNRGIAIGRLASANGSSTITDGPIVLGHGASGTSTLNIALGTGSTVSATRAAAIGRLASAINSYEGVLGTGVAEDGTRTWRVPGNFSVTGTKNFEIPHPHPNKKATHAIRHGAVESPTEGDTLYRYSIEATADNQTIEIQLPDYFQYLNKNVDIWVNGHKHFGNGFGIVEDDILKVTCEKVGEYKVLVIGTRNDENVQDWSIKGVEREIGESWLGETYVFEVDEIIEIEEITEVA